jgi:ABC-2 type transport system permease protein
VEEGKMRDDILTVIWKERKGLFRVRGRRAQALLAMVSPVLLAIYFPLQEGAAWEESPLSMLLAFVTPLILVGISIPDSFAGERERRTLPTLLASRLSDRSILFGKIVTSVVFGWGVTLMLLAVSLVTVNVAHWDGHVLFFKPSILLAALAFSFLIAVLTAAAGVLFSLRAATAQEAQQTLMGVLLIPPVILQFALFAILASESGKARLREVWEATSLEQVIIVIVAILLLLDLGLLTAAMARFKRARLILS